MEVLPIPLLSPFGVNIKSCTPLVIVDPATDDVATESISYQGSPL
jgi:hypothetical protein